MKIDNTNLRNIKIMRIKQSFIAIISLLCLFIANQAYGRPNISPYSYCSGNPINRIDPDGRDDFKLNRNGSMQLVKQTESDNHTVYATKSNGKVDSKNSIQVDKSLVDSKQTETVQGRGSDNSVESYTVDGYTSSNTEQATQFFEFAAGNTDVEWSQTNISSNGVESSVITTSQSDGAEAGQSKLVDGIISGASGTTISSANHSHNNGTTTVSSQDVKIATKVQGAFPNATMNIYSPTTKQYTPFSSSSIPGMLPVINVNFNNKKP